MGRNIKLDAIKGMLIILAVVVHYQQGILKDIIFFHMPLFFVLSGFFYKEDSGFSLSYIERCASRYLIPYITYIVCVLVFLDRDFSSSHLVHLAYGGRAIAGVYWYMTCMVFAILLYTFIRSKFSDRTVKCMLLVGAGIAVIESHLIEYIDLLKYPGIPWNLDVSMMAMVYIGIGFYCKNQTKIILESEDRKYDLVAVIVTVALIVFCYFNYRTGEARYYFDMKSVYYKELVLAVVIPCLFGFVICRITYWLDKVKAMENVFAFLGRLIIPIMFLHVPLNQWREDIGYGFFVYVIIGIVVPIIFTMVFCRFVIMRKLFGLPDLYRKRREL